MKISVILASYNGEKYIEEQLNSILNQTMIPNEILVYDDCSSDATYEIVKKVALNNPNITWHIKKNIANIGFRSNFKELIVNSKGDIVFLCDQDDIWELNKIENMSKILINNNQIDILVSDFDYLFEGNVTTDQNAERKIYGKKVNDEVEQVIFKKNNYLNSRPGWTFAFKRKVICDFNMISDLSKELFHDEIIWYIGLIGEGLYYYKYVGGKWRRLNYSVTAKSDEGKIVNFMRLIDKRYLRSCDIFNIYLYYREKKSIQKKLELFGLYARMRLYFFSVLKFFEKRIKL